MWWRIVLAFWKLAAFRNAPIRDAFFRLVLLPSHYLVNGNFLCTDSTGWRKENELAGKARLFCLCLVDGGTGASGEGRIIPLSAGGVTRVAAAW